MPDELNPARRDAVRTLRGPLLILAGAGTGKTRVVTHRIARLIRQGVPPNRILAVTFTNKAASEMQDRARKLLRSARGSADRPEISTFHSLCVRILRRQIHRLGYPRQFAICDRSDQEGVARSVLREIQVSGTRLRPADLLQHIGRWRSDAISPNAAAAAAETDQQHLAAVGYRRYLKHLKAKGAVDFDDMLHLAQRLLTRVPEVRHEEAGRFDHVLIDEYQDTNDSQYRIAKALAGDHRNLCVVGDDDQSIYGWRGARVTHILEFQRDWPDAKVVRLEENYRSAAPILVMANRLIAFNRSRHDKQLRPARPGGQRPRILQFASAEAEAKGIVRDVKSRLARPGTRPDDLAILFRTNEQPRPFETELRTARLPYVLIGGMSFYDRKEVRDVLAYLSVLANPRDETALLRILNTPPRGIGPKAAHLLVEEAVHQGSTAWDLLPQADQLDAVPPKAAESMRNFHRRMALRAAGLTSDGIAETARRLVSEVGYRDELGRIYREPDELESRLRSVDEVLRSVADYEENHRNASLQQFVDDAILRQRGDENDKDADLGRNAIALMTLHSAKGLEFPEVYLVGMEEGILPHRRSISDGERAIDEERRLCYVGVTRAQDRLTMSLALSRRAWGKRRETQPSRFLFELTGQAERAPTAKRQSG